MSIWETVEGKYRKYNHWPNPFRTTPTEMRTMVCNGEEWYGFSKAYAYGAGNWFFSNFIPSPAEIVRKTLTGGYKCGFYLPIKFKSPLDIIWTDGAGSFILRKALQPLVLAAFIWWAADTIFSGLSAITTIIMYQESCGAALNNCIWSRGFWGFLGGTTPEGGAQSFDETWQPPIFGGVAIAGSLTVTGTGTVTSEAFITIPTAPGNMTYFEAWLRGPSSDGPHVILANPSNPSVSGIHLTISSFQTLAGIYAVMASCICTEGPGIRAHIDVARWFTAFVPGGPAPKCFSSEWTGRFPS